LKLWASFHKKAIPQGLIADALFPNWTGDTTEVVRKTTMKLAKKALTWDTIHALQVQATIETGSL
jgi:hypothetical protein